MVTAGHCIDGQSNLVAQFNVPNSNANCGTVNPPVNDQFPVLPGFQFQNVNPGNDWGVYLTGTNGLGQTPFQRYGQFRPLAAAPSGVGAVANFWGYGLDTNCVRSQTQQFSTGPITAVNADYYDFSADVRGGNSGSGYLNAAGQIIGIVTHCRVGCPNVAQRVDDAAFVAARRIEQQVATPTPCLGRQQPAVEPQRVAELHMSLVEPPRGHAHDHRTGARGEGPANRAAVR
jgi:V8-like Glu-specific endopeptidase